MDFQAAVEIVATDQNEGDWADEAAMTPREAVEHVRNIMTLADVIDYGDENTEAYRMVLSTAQLPKYSPGSARIRGRKYLFGAFSLFSCVPRLTPRVPASDGFSRPSLCEEQEADRAEPEEHDPHDEAPQKRHAEQSMPSVFENAFEDVRDKEVGHREEHCEDAPLVAAATVNDPLNEPEARKVTVKGGDHSRDSRNDEAQHDDSSSLAHCDE